MFNAFIFRQAVTKSVAGPSREQPPIKIFSQNQECILKTRSSAYKLILIWSKYSLTKEKISFSK